jgi:hypothetical protein
MAVWAASRLLPHENFADLARRLREHEADIEVIEELDRAEAACISSS